MSAAPDWYPKRSDAASGGEIFWEDGGETGAADYEAWKDAGIE